MGQGVRQQQLAIFARGFLIVTLTSANVAQIASRHYGGAFVGGCAISFVWFGNSRTAAMTEVPYAREIYALGAGLGTLTGMLLMRWFYGR
jgi:hypothetical protein